MKPLSKQLVRSSARVRWLLYLVAALMLVACQPVQPTLPQTDEVASPTMPEVLIEVDDTEITIPADFPGGIVAVTVKNNSSQDLDVGLTRVREGNSAEELMELAPNFMDNLVPIMQMGSFLMSFNPIPVGESGRAIIDFKTGEFIVDATEHAEEEPLPGVEIIYGTFTASEVVGTVEPQADVTVDMSDFTFVMPDEISAGKQLWGFTNSGQQWHMLFGIKPNAGASMEEILAVLAEEGEPSGPPPFEFIENFGIPPIGQGERVWQEAELAAGTYLVICPLPDMAAIMAGEMPMSHLHHGMHRTLIVTGDAATMPISTLPQVTIIAKDFAFEMPDEIAAGLVSLTFTNEGAVNHHGYVMRLLDGVTLDQVTEAMAADQGGEGETEEAGVELNDLAFFLPDTDPGTSNQVTVELAPGRWLIVSFSMDSTGEEMPPLPDWAKGSIQEFTVTDGGESAAAPEADLVVTIGEDDFEMPTGLTAGEQTIQVVNGSGADDAYAFFIKLGGDTTVEDLLAAFEAMFTGQEPEKMPQVSTVGGLMGYNASDSFYTTITFEPGNYAVISSINGDDFPYSGLYKNFTVK